MYWKLFLRKRVVLSILAVVALIVIVNFIATRKKLSSSVTPWWQQPAPCSHTVEIEKDMYLLLEQLHNLFVEMNVTHFICYGTLWGAIRYSKLLPFDRDVDICVLYDDELSALQQHELIKKVKERYPHLYILFDANQNIYNVYLNKAMGEVVFFQRNGASVDRALSKLEHGGDAIDSFPARFISELHEMNLGSLKLPAPDSDIMRYMYPDTYTIEKKPPNCF